MHPRLGVSKGRIGKHVEQRTSCAEGGTEAPKGSCGWVHLREDSGSGSWVETSCETGMCGTVCVAASRGGVEVGSGCGGEST